MNNREVTIEGKLLWEEKPPGWFTQKIAFCVRERLVTVHVLFGKIDQPGWYHLEGVWKKGHFECYSWERQPDFVCKW